MEGWNLKNYGADQQRLQISELHFHKFPTPQTFSCWKTRFKAEVCSCSNFPTEAIRWIIEVEMVNSVDDLKSSCSIQRTNPFPDFEVLDANIASALNKIIQNSCFKKEVVSLEEQKVLKANQFLRGKQIACLIYDYFRVIGVNESVLDCAYLFSVVLRNDDIQEFDTRWDKILLSVEQFPTWWYPGKSVQMKSTRVWENQDRVRSVQLGDSSQKNETWSSQAEDNCKKMSWAKFEITELWGQNWKNWVKHVGQESEGTTSRSQRTRRMLAMATPTGSAQKETNAVSGTMVISVQKLRHRQLLLQNLRRNHKMWKI